MCILSFLPTEVDLNEEAIQDLKNGGLTNPDGHGWAIASPTGMILGKSLNLDDALESFVKARDFHTGPALFHSRFATHGSVKVGNCHPFLVGGSNNQTVLAHNGILPKDAHPAKGDDRSDSGILAEEILPRRWFRLDKPTVQQSMRQWLTPYNKVVILTVNPRYRENAYILNQAQGWWDEPTGIWHSNQDYLDPWPRWVHSYRSKWGGHWADAKADEAGTENPDICHFCDGAVNSQMFCTYCGTCQDCLMEPEECQCYAKANAEVATLGYWTGR